MGKALDLVRARRWAETGIARELRENAGLSLDEIASPVGVDRTTVSKWERGLRRPRGDAAIRWLRLLEELAQ